MLATLPLEAFVCRSVMETFYFPDEPHSPNRHLLFTTSLVVASVALALITCDLGSVFELIGSTSACALAYILPPMCFIKLSQKPWQAKIPAYLCIVFGSVVMAISVVKAVVDAINDATIQTRLQILIFALGDKAGITDSAHFIVAEEYRGIPSPGLLDLPSVPMMITEIEQSTQHEPIANEAERRLKELQMMDLGTQRREYITTVDAPSKYKNVTLQEIEASRRANVDPKIKSMAEANKQRLSAWNNVHETLGGDVDIEDLDSLMDGQSHRARLCDLVREQGGQRYVEPEPLFNGHYHHSSPSRPNGKPSRPNGKPSSFRKRGKVAITNAAGRTRKALPRLGKYIVELPPAPGKASSLSSKPPGKKKSKPTVVSQLDPAKNPALMPAQPPINAVTALRTGNSPKPPSVASSTDTKASKVSQYKLRRTVTRPPRVATGPSVYPTDMADPNDFMKAVEAAMPVDKITRSPTIATAAATSSVATTTIPSSPVSSSASRRSFLVVDDPTTLMMKAASIVAKPGESLAVSSATNGLIDQLHAPETTKDMSTSSVGNIQVGSVAHQGSLKQSVTVPEDIGAQVDTQHEESTQTTIMSGQVGQTQESVSREAPTPVYEARNHQVCNYPKPLIGNGNMSNLQEGTMSKTATAPTADLLDLDFDDTPVDPTPRPPRPSLCLGMMPFTPPPPKTPALQTPHSSQSITPKQNRALEAYLRIFVRFRVELRKIRQLAKKTATDDDLQRYLEQRKQEIEEDYHILWEELTEHYPDIDLDEIEEEVLIRSLTVRIKILDADLDHYRKKHEEAKHQIEPMTQPKPIARREGLNTVSTIITPSTHEVLTLSSLPLIAPEPVTSTAPAAQTVNPAAESCTKKPQAPVLTPSSVRTQIECRANNGANAPIGGSDFPGRLHNRSPTTASVTP
ncbi:hypothetical protein KEM54_005753, partial [Ascosphaera aggregata]